ncbi:short-chain dehydrogenase reductase SDR [Dipodascopsis uninucleata]
MVSIDLIRQSNAHISTTFPAGLVALFVGATSGIGEHSLKAFAKYFNKPRVYFIGRSQEAGNRIVSECKAINSAGEYIFIKCDITSLKRIDKVCQDIKNKETTLNLLFISAGTLANGKTEEGLHLSVAVVYYCRLRFIVNMIPLLRKASHLRRVVNAFVGAHEGPIDIRDIQSWNIPLTAYRGQHASMLTLMLEVIARSAPEVTFIHDFPGVVKSGLLRDATGIIMLLFKAYFTVVGPFVYMSGEECGDRQLFFATSSRYLSSSGVACGVPMTDGITTATATNSTVGGGVYSINSDGEPASAKVTTLLNDLRKNGTVDALCDDVETIFTAITGSKAI